ncbi:tetratricopeptide repeat protein [Micromonospora sp. KC721]|uniref:tetratricopeptide repeat protein n=1 Tax=Micromonospora sp. KC721 TaxID=2530380 RepID=UPI0010432054|nr:tetratricopeptide repeat protein [Micromonospora sp. KC721]TDB81057.1 tetratricopeptide repeat protein [Micromonospora sp. KC721]
MITLQSPAIQNVTAVAGFAYGAIGADIHVFGDGSPVYLLETHQPPPMLDRVWLRELPSRMLNARSQVVTFTGRRRERDELAVWREGGPRLAVRWLHAAGGQGKTRLADRVAADAAEQGWKVIVAAHGVGAVQPSPGSQDLRISGHRGVLLVVDYADRWTTSALTWLLRNTVLHQPDVPARVLLVARTTTGWPALRAALQDPRVQAGTSEQPLAILASGNARQAMFAAARNSFAAVYDLDDPVAIAAPADLARPEFGLALAVQVAALVAVDTHATGASPPNSPSQLTEYLLDREQQHWDRLYEGRTRGLDHHTPPSVMARTAFTAALTGPLPHPDAVALLDRVEKELPAERILTDHTRCYPPVGRSRDSVLEPLFPDRLAEDFLALTLLGHPTSQPGHSWATTRLNQLLPAPPVRQGRTGAPEDPAYLARTITFLTAAAANWPHLRAAHLYPLLRARPELALAAGGATLATLATLADVDLAVLEAVEALLPTERHIDLDIAAAAISTTLTAHRLDATDDPAAHARLHAAHAMRLANAGLREEALASAEKSTAIYRHLAEADPAAHLPGLASSLGNLGVFLSLLGRYEQALDPARQATDIYRQLALMNPAGWPGLAGSLSNLCVRLAELGRFTEALGPARQATDIYRQLALADPERHRPGLARALNNLGVRLSELGGFAEAVLPTKESIYICRALTEVNPDAYLPDLGDAVTNLGVYLAQLGRPERALRHAEEAVAIFRQLAERNPQAYRPNLAKALRNLGITQAGRGSRDHALSRAAEAVGLYRELVKADRTAWLPDLAMSLGAYAWVCVTVGAEDAELKQALEAITEAVELFGLLAEHLPRAFEGQVLSACRTRADVLDKLRRTDEATELRRQFGRGR